MKFLDAFKHWNAYFFALGIEFVTTRAQMFVCLRRFSLSVSFATPSGDGRMLAGLSKVGICWSLAGAKIRRGES